MHLQMIDYRKFRLNKLNDKEFSHIKPLLFWPLFGLVFSFLEKGLKLNYQTIYCSFDDKIPFCEYFIIPYYFWFVFLIGMQIYAFFFDIPAFRNYINFTILTYTVTIIVYILFPNQQTLRPMTLPRDNIFSDIVAWMYNFDTNTNVCPSIHVLGSFAVYFSARKSKLFSGFWWRAAFLVMTVLISVSTVFLKQHSIIDIIAALVLCAVAYPFVYMPDRIKGIKSAFCKVKD